MQKILPKKDFNKFIQELIKTHQVIAPVKNPNSKFQIIQNPEEINISQITQVPPKKFFLPDNEIISEFKNNKTIQPKSLSLILETFCFFKLLIKKQNL